MRVVDAAVTKDQDDVFRAAEIDEAELDLVAKGKALDLEVRRWLASKMNKSLNKSRLTAQVLARSGSECPEITRQCMADAGWGSFWNIS